MQSIPGVRSKGFFCSVCASRSLRLAVCVLVVASSALAQPLPPELTRPVNDFAGVIDADSARQMESLIRSLQETTGDVVAVATIDSLGGEDINQYAVKMFENHGKGIGQKGKDNGLLVLVAIKDRSVKIEVGYDLEQFITDGFAGETIREEMAPRFRRGEYGAGLGAAVTRIIGRIADGRNVTISGAPRIRTSRRPDPDRGRNFIGVIVIVFILINLIAGRLRRRGRRHWGGGGWSGWHSGVGPFGGGLGGFGRGGGGFGGGFGGFGGFGGGRSGGGGAGGSW
jgi:uncharacterized protein